MDGDTDDFFITPSRVSLLPLPTPSQTQRSSLSSRLAQPGRPARKKMAWISLQGRLVGAEEATSALAIGGGLSRDEAVAWELFGPLQRVLVVAVAAAAAKESRKGREIAKLQRSVEIRDEVLQNMQKKLEDLCEQMNSSKDQLMNHAVKTPIQSGDEFTGFGISERKESDICSCERWLPRLNPDSGITPLSGNLSNSTKGVEIETNKIEMFKSGRVSMGEPEERRMSGLSDFSSVSSSIDLQMSTLAEGQDLYNLPKECEEKDAIIKELTAASHASGIAESKRISELEEIIRRKNMNITKLKKDMLYLEQKVIQLTRQQRPSTASSMGRRKSLPVMATNIIYDMSSSSLSSSDSDTPIEQYAIKSQPQAPAKSLGYSKVSEVDLNSPIKASRSVPKIDFNRESRTKRLVSGSADTKRSKRRTQQESKRWV